jgi:hypothetical protein
MTMTPLRPALAQISLQCCQTELQLLPGMNAKPAVGPWVSHRCRSRLLHRLSYTPRADRVSWLRFDDHLTIHPRG